MPRVHHGSKMIDNPKLTCNTQADWERWLDANGGCSAEITTGSTTRGVWLRIAKRTAAEPTVTYAQALESALCFGWIDGQKQAESEHYWLQRFTPRTAHSIWSQINKAKVAGLIAAGKMRPAGLREVAQARRNGRWDAAYSPASSATVPDDLQLALASNPKAKEFFETLHSANRYAILFRLQNVKRADTRAKKIVQFVNMLSRGEKLHP